MVSHCIRSKHYACSEFRRASVPYCRTATSEAVVYVAGPALGHGIFAITSVPSSFSMRSALLNPPSNFSTSRTGEIVGPVEAASSQRASTSNLTYRQSRCCFSRVKNRPFVYWKSSSRLIDLPALVIRCRGV